MDDMRVRGCVDEWEVGGGFDRLIFERREEEEGRNRRKGREREREEGSKERG